MTKLTVFAMGVLAGLSVVCLICEKCGVEITLQSPIKIESTCAPACEPPAAPRCEPPAAPKPKPAPKPAEVCAPFPDPACPSGG
jgi:hypothetical protein